ncbi:thiamine diphosphokinase [Acidaminobacter hydrogenoformans]|uniref:Thiamine diphosphokinase n=1 Tax=Acidaminobacter hydrogenoformans DSM 2784 TaxID=1120920 RepID=A0A1G5RU33_9FIRM|nr:thiamine diphosphokinase [Acidaminobacter hydrogenoformans]SCZ76951.1 thiamine pyrophosphokinase [Acidaminobacter hydrogenoformans DSM 2784]
MRVAIVTGGALEDLDWLKDQLSSYDQIIAVDRGLEAFESMGLIPDFIIGDFDSYAGCADFETRYPETEVMTFDSQKDWTDTELALHKAMALCATHPEGSVIDMFGAFGSRVDHMFANLMLLTSIKEKYPRVRALDPNNEVERLYPGTYGIIRREGFYVSVLSIDEAASVSLRGFEYDGEALRMYRSGTLGVSNRLIEDTGSVEVQEGPVFLMQCRDRK